MEQRSKPADVRGPRLVRDIAESLGRLPPSAPDMEEAVLGALILEKHALPEIIGYLRPAHFYVEAHKEIYQAIQDLYATSDPVDMRTVVAQLRKNGKLEIVGGAYYIAELTSKVSSAANIEYHARIIQEHHLKRELIGMASNIHHKAYEETTDVFELIDWTNQEMQKAMDANLSGQAEKHIKEIAIKALTDMQGRMAGHYTGVMSGYESVDKILNGHQNGDLIIIGGRPGMAKCLGHGTKVLMFNGTLKEVQDITTGDYLMGADSKPRLVLNTTFGRSQMYWIRQNKGIDYRVNEDHILSLKASGTDGFRIHGAITNISVNDYLNKSEKFQMRHKGYKVEINFPHVEVPIEPYFLGIWLGDGTTLATSVSKPDQEIRDYLEGYAKRLGQKLHYSKRPTKTCPTLSITGGTHRLRGLMNALGLIGNKHIPHQFLKNSRKQRLELLAGLLDTDGHYQAEHHVFRIVQIKEDLAIQIKFLADTLGFKSSINTRTAKIKSIGFSCLAYSVCISGNIHEIPTRIKRKQAPNKLRNNNHRITGIKVEKDIIDTYFGFTLDGDGLFLLEDMTVTHNSNFAFQELVQVAKTGIPVAIFSLEMPAIQLINRAACAEAELDNDKVAKGTLTEQELQLYMNALSVLMALPIYIDDAAMLNNLELRARCRRLTMKFGVRLIVVDYLQLLKGVSEQKNFNRDQEIGIITRTLKAIAKELQIPVIAISALGRDVEKRGGAKRPQLSDLREGGAIEADADVVIFLYRPEYYHITQDENGYPTHGQCEIIVAKHRNGALGTAMLKFIGRLTKFKEWVGVSKPDYTAGVKNPGSPERELPFAAPPLDPETPF